MSGTAVLLATCLTTFVGDGDSLFAICPGDEVAREARLFEGDSPEVWHKKSPVPAQPWGEEAKHALTLLCLHKPTVIDPHYVDPKHPHRMVATVICDGVNAGREMVRLGHAWAWEREPWKEVPKLQKAAQEQKVGLWSLPHPVRPSDWRKGDR